MSMPLLIPDEFKADSGGVFPVRTPEFSRIDFVVRSRKVLCSPVHPLGAPSCADPVPCYEPRSNHAQAHRARLIGLRCTAPYKHHPALLEQPLDPRIGR